MAIKSHNKGRWYVKAHNKIQGPFPNQLISRYLILGRLTLDTQISQDQKHWNPIKDYPSLVPEVVVNAHTREGAKALRLARIREDERSSQEAAAEGIEQRADEDQVIKLHRKLRDDILKEYRDKPRLNTRAMVAVIAVAILLLILLVSYRPERLVTSNDCSLPATAGVDWSMCNKQGQNLAGADLRQAKLRNAILNNVDLSRARLDGSDLAYSNLYQADMQHSSLQNVVLTGANLRQANLQGASLRGADLSYAELEGARLDGSLLDQARLDHAIWLNGEQCLPGSIGGCLQSR